MASDFHPKISIVIPVYNGAKYVQLAIRSALDQTYDNIEVIVVNDGSADGGATERQVSAFRDRIRYVAKENGGVATALNRGIEEMNGDYFSWLSHDDLYVPEKIELQVRSLAEAPDLSKQILYGDYEVFTDDPEDGTPSALPHVEPEGFRSFITTANVLHGCTLLVPRQAFEEHGRFNPKLRTTQDYDLWFRMATTYAFVHEPVLLVRARNHSEQGTLQMSDLVLAECNRLLGGFVEQLSEAEVLQGEARSPVEGYFLLARNLETRGFAQASARAADLCSQSFDKLDKDDLLDLLQRKAEATEALTRSSTEIDLLNRHRDACLVEVQRISQELDASQMEKQELGQRLEQVIGSWSWRITRPLRYLRRIVRRFLR